MPNRKILHHVVEGDRAPQLDIAAIDEPGQGGACHEYEISWQESYPSEDDPAAGRVVLPISFQNGPIAEHGINGVTQEALLAIVIDRLESFQAGPFKSDYNNMALMSVRNALQALQMRTQDRIRRGVEGRNEK